MLRSLKIFYAFLLSLSIWLPTHGMNLNTQQLDDTTYELTLSFDSSPTHYIYADYFDFRVNEPAAKITNTRYSTEPTSVYDKTFKTNEKVFNKPFDITFTVKSSVNLTGAHLLVTYYPSDKKNITQEQLLILLPATCCDAQTGVCELQTKTTHATPVPAASQPWYLRVANMIQTTNSDFLRILFAFILGLLCSLTPCLYPMIPITIGILQEEGSKNIWYNFFISLSYTIGIATTFAVLGLAAAITGHLFGSLMNNPIVIICIVLMIAYFSGAMIGFYNLYIPSWLQPKQSKVRKGSFISAFIFGAISGTVASPCLSPGLLSLLSYVSALSNVLLGFTLLFSFGIGIGMPLLIIGTFSGSLSILPRAGMWMVELKELLGFVMFGMVFYFLKPLMSEPMLLWLIALYLLAVGLFYLYQASRLRLPFTSFKNIVGTIVLATSMFVGYLAAQKTWFPEIAHKGYWLEDYLHACEQAKKENKPVLLKVSTAYCTICKKIDEKIFSHETVSSRIKEFCIPVKISDFDPSNPLHEKLKQQFNIMGVPFCCVVKPDGTQVCKQWGPELYDMSPAEFMQQLSEVTP